MYSYLDHCTIWCKLTTDGLFGSTYSKIGRLVVIALWPGTVWRVPPSRKRLRKLDARLC